MLLNLVDPDINEEVTRNALILTVLDGLIHGSLQSRVIRLVADLMTILALNSCSGGQIVIQVANVKARRRGKLAEPVFWCLNCAPSQY